jgi:hypothetical protein
LFEGVNEKELLLQAYSLILVCILPSVVFILKKQWTTRTFPFIPLTGIFAAVNYGLPVFSIPQSSYQLGILSVESISIAFVGFFVFFITIHLADVFKIYRFKIFSIVSFSNISSVKKIAYSLLLIYSLATLKITSIFNNLTFFSLIGYISIVYCLYLNRRIAWYEKIVLLSIVMYELIDRTLSGLLASLAIFVIFLVLLDLILKKNVFRILPVLLSFVVIYILISPVKNLYRYEVWNSSKSYDFVSKVTLIVYLIESGTENTDNKINKDQDKFLWRFSYPASALSEVINRTPNKVPYWNGETYFSLFYKFIPRAIWPNKPEENIGQQFGKRYNFLDITDNSTSMNLPLMAEFYANFGYWGIIGGMFLLGLLYALIDFFFNNANNDVYNKLLGFVIIFPLIIQESNFTLSFGNLILIPIFLYVLLKFFNRH